MSTIDKNTDLMTLVNVFTVKPENQEKLVTLLTDATEQVMRNLPGFVSANIHRSLDGKRVVNYAQWKSEDDFQAMKSDPEAQKHMKAVADLAEFDPIVCEVVESISADTFV
jgi:heme-degrading monooxygenase HmoA